ncbi:ribosome biogenesis protein [Candidatus Micrarchaeota archaeon]|nr:ribosome biogenesis protein [Candidatus Micrarchaeota archaeon]
MKKMRKCGVCGEYSLDEIHCSTGTSSAHPPPFNPNDRYAHYRRARKESGCEL